MKNILTFVLMIFVCQTLQAQSSKMVDITGKVSGDTKGYDYIYFYSGTNPMDSVRIQNGQFVIRIPFSETHVQVLMTQYAKIVKRSYQTLVLLIDGGGHVLIDMDIDKGIAEARVTGSPTAAAYVDFRKQQSAVNKRVDDALLSLYGKPFIPAEDPLQKQFLASRDSLSKLYMGALVSTFVATHKDAYLGVYVLASLGRSVFHIDKLDSTLHTLSSAMQKTREGEKMAAYIRGARNTKIGGTVKNFELRNPAGQLISFDQFKGKYVWIDFWASWCAPCKKAFPHMKELYSRYKEKGLEILGISTDTKIDPWLKILPELQNPWPQVWDNQNVMSEFAVTAFPTSFLIDPKGVILLKEVGYNPDGDSPMDKKLKELFDRNPVHPKN